MDLGITGISEVTRHAKGGSSTVYRARQDRFDRDVAIKVLNGSPSEELSDRLNRELRVSGRVSGHPGILEIFDSGTTADGNPWLMMPFVAGESLQQELNRRGASTVDAAVADVIKVAEAIEYAHRNGVVHCDIKPANILRGNIGQPIIIDFGVSQVDNPTDNPPVSSGATPAYTAPERFRQAAPDARTDVYSLAALLYAMLNGRPAFLDGENTSVADVVRRATTEPPARIAGVPSSVMQVVLHGMSKRPVNRPRSAGLFAHFLSVALKDHADKVAQQSHINSQQAEHTRRLAEQSQLYHARRNERIPATVGTDAAERRDSVFSTPAPATDARVSEARNAVRSTPPADRPSDLMFPDVPRNRFNPGPAPDAEPADGFDYSNPSPAAAETRQRGMWWTGAAAVALLIMVGGGFLLWRFALGLSDPSAPPVETSAALVEAETSDEPQTEAAPAITDAAPSDAGTSDEPKTDAKEPTAEDVTDAAELPDSAAVDALSDDFATVDDTAAVEPNYEGLRFVAHLDSGWAPVSEDRDVGYGYRTRFEGQNTDFMYVDFTPPERQSGSETIEESAKRIANQIRSSSDVQFLEIGDKDTWWFSYIGNDGSERIDVFFVDGGTGYAVVGGSHGDPKASWETVYNFVANLQTR